MRCAVLGDPIAHSLSPVLHRAAYADRGLDWTYDAVRVPAGGLPAFLAGLDDGWRGLSLTMPLKREVLALGARAPQRRGRPGRGRQHRGARRRGSGWRSTTPTCRAPRPPSGSGTTGRSPAVTILGAGATAASVGLALCDLGARDGAAARPLAGAGGRDAWPRWPRTRRARR